MGAAGQACRQSGASAFPNDRPGAAVVTSTRRPVVLIAEKLAPSVLDLLGDSVEVRNVDGTDRPALLSAVAEADALLVRSATQVDAEVLGATTRLKVVARAGVGVDNVDVAAATERGVLVVNAPTANLQIGRASCRERVSSPV